MSAFVRPALAMSLIVASFQLAAGCKRPSPPSATPDSAARTAAAAAPSPGGDGLMKARFSCPHGKPEYRIEGQQVIVTCPDR